MTTSKQKSVYTAYSRALSMIINILSQFILTPIVLGFLGTTLYGVYTLVNKTNNYLSLVDIRPTAILRLKLAYDQASNNLDEKKKYIGASIVISLIFTPVFIVAGIVLAYFFPVLFHVDLEYVTVSRWAIILLSIFLAINGFLGIPEAILRGNNLEYKGFFVEPIRNLMVAGLTILFLYFGLGLLSVVYAMFIAAVFSYGARQYLKLKYLAQFSATMPEKHHVAEFFGKGGWYLLSSFLVQTINNFDVILIGILLNPESVTLFAITKAIVFRVVESVETLVASTTSSIGEIVGTNDCARIHTMRYSLYKLVLPLAILVTGYFFVFNGAFIELWTGGNVYAGNIVNFIICISAFFLMLTSTEEIFVISYLDFKKKAICLSVSALTAIVISVSFSSSLGLIGNAVGILSGRLVLFVLYNYLNNTKLKMKLTFEFVFIIKCLMALIITALSFLLFTRYYEKSVIVFAVSSAIYVTLITVYIYKVILDEGIRKQIINAIIKKK